MKAAGWMWLVGLGIVGVLFLALAQIFGSVPQDDLHYSSEMCEDDHTAWVTQGYVWLCEGKVLPSGNLVYIPQAYQGEYLTQAKGKPLKGFCTSDDLQTDYREVYLRTDIVTVVVEKGVARAYYKGLLGSSVQLIPLETLAYLGYDVQPAQMVELYICEKSFNYRTRIKGTWQATISDILENHPDVGSRYREHIVNRQTFDFKFTITDDILVQANGFCRTEPDLTILCFDVPITGILGQALDTSMMTVFTGLIASDRQQYLIVTDITYQSRIYIPIEQLPDTAQVIKVNYTGTGVLDVEVVKP